MRQFTSFLPRLLLLPLQAGCFYLGPTPTLAKDGDTAWDTSVDTDEVVSD